MERRGEIGVAGATDDFVNGVYRFGAFTLDEKRSELREDLAMEIARLGRALHDARSRATQRPGDDRTVRP